MGVSGHIVLRYYKQVLVNKSWRNLLMHKALIGRHSQYMWYLLVWCVRND